MHVTLTNRIAVSSRMLLSTVAVLNVPVDIEIYDQ